MDAKIYDKEIYQKNESLKNTIIIILVFLIGFFSGYVASSFSSSTSENNSSNITNVSASK